MAVSPLNVLIISVPYHFSILLLLGAVFLLLWKVLKPFHHPLAILACFSCAILMLLGQIDFGVQRYLDHRLTISMIKTYMTRHLLSSELYNPLLFDPFYLFTALGIILSAWLVIAIKAAHYFHLSRKRTVPWSVILLFFSAAWVFNYLLSFSYGFQRAVLKQPSVYYA